VAGDAALMPAKRQAKRRGRPPLPKAARREVFPVRLMPDLIARAKAHGSPTEIAEKALVAWLDQREGRVVG